MTRCRNAYIHPEVASIGYNKESEAKNIKTKSFKVSFNAIGKAVIEETTNDRGFCEMIINDETNEIIGINMIGPQVTELINEASLLQFMNGSIELGLTTHAHPSISEVLMEWD